MHLSDLQSKDVINVVDGRKIGNIVDACVEQGSGKITKLVVEPNRTFNKFFSTKEEFDVVWEQIIKIGEDVILVDLNRSRTLLLK